MPNPLTASILIDSSFTTQSLNEHVLVCTKLSEKDLTRKDLKTWIIENKDSVSRKKEVISISDDNLQSAPTKFLGFDFLETEAVAESVSPGREPNEFNIVLDRTP